MDQLWSPNFSLGPKRTPRLFTRVILSNDPSLSVYFAYWGLIRQIVITLHLEQFKSSKLSKHHVRKLFQSDCKLDWQEVSFYYWHNLTSSAYISTREWVITEGRIFIHKVKSSTLVGHRRRRGAYKNFLKVLFVFCNSDNLRYINSIFVLQA